MTILLGDTGKVAYGSYKSLGISLATPQETLLTGVSVLTLPTAEPATPQISYTIQASDMPTFSGGYPLSVAYTPLVFVGGKIGAASTNLNYRISLNGASQVQSANNAVGATLYYTYNFGRFIPVVVGDVVTISLWSSQADTQLDYYALSVQPSRMAVTKSGVILKDLTIGVGTLYPTLTLGVPAQAGTNNFVVIPSSLGSASINVNTIAATFPAMIQEPTYQTGRVGYGDTTNTTGLQTHATNRPLYQRNYIPQTISFREILR